MAERLVIIINHQKHRLVEKVDFITSPGYLDGGDARKKAGLPGGGPAVIITDRAILKPHGPSNEFHLASIHPGHTIEEVVANTGWDLKSVPDVGMTPDQVRQTLGRPTAITRVATTGRVNEVWIFGERGTSRLCVHFLRRSQTSNSAAKVIRVSQIDAP